MLGLVGLGVQDSRLEVLGLRLWGLGVWGSGYKVLVGFGKVASSFLHGALLNSLQGFTRCTGFWEARTSEPY